MSYLQLQETTVLYSYINENLSVYYDQPQIRNCFKFRISLFINTRNQALTLQQQPIQ